MRGAGQAKGGWVALATGLSGKGKRGSGPAGFGIFGLGFGSSLFYSLS